MIGCTDGWENVRMAAAQTWLSRRGACTAGLFAMPLAARAQQAAYPAHPVRLTVPYPAGGTTDVVARIAAEALSPRLGQPAVIDNRPGGGVTVATNFVARAAPDGYSLLVTTLAHATNPFLFRSLPYDSEGDFAPVGMIGLTPCVLVVNPRSAARDLAGFIALLRAESERHAFGSAGVGTPMHLAPELLAQMTGTKVRHIPYRGEAPALNDLVAGHVSFVLDPVTAAAPLVRAGALRALAVASARRSETLPEIPTFAEAGLAGFEAYTWAVILAPRGTPPEIVERLNHELGAVLGMPEVRRRLTELGVEMGRIFSPAETGAFIRAEASKWAPILRASGVALD
jgi:tripartite-type tricarboxylate transporter receptor subunit TctC